MDQEERKAPVKRARHAFFAKLAEKANAEWRKGRGRAVALHGDIDGGGRLVWIVVPPHAQPGTFFPHRGVKGHPLKRTTDGRYVESKEEDVVWEQECSDEATALCPIGPVPDPRPVRMPITVWAREQRPSEAAKAAAKVAEAAAKAAEAEAVGSALEAAWETDDDGAGDESDDNEEGEAEEGEAAPTAAAPTASSVVVTTPTTASALAAPAAPAAAPASAAADANARIEAAVAAALAEATQGGMSVAVATRTVRCSRA